MWIIVQNIYEGMLLGARPVGKGRAGVVCGRGLAAEQSRQGLSQHVGSSGVGAAFSIVPGCCYQPVLPCGAALGN